MPNIGPAELMMILAIALIVFGPKKLPEIGKGIGTALREFNKARNDLMDSLHAEIEEPVRRAMPVLDDSPSVSHHESYASAPEGTAHRADYAHAAAETATPDALPYGSDFHAVEGDSQPSFRGAEPVAVAAASPTSHASAPAGHGGPAETPA